MSLSNAARAYGATRTSMSPREREADVIERVIGTLKSVLDKDGPPRARALADNRRLWLAIESTLAHPMNELPPGLRAGLISLSRTVQKELDKPEPDIAFLIEVNEQIAAGLSGKI